MRIGPIDIPGIDGTALWLAPMDDVSDKPFRQVCKRHGADVVVTEFIQSSLLVHGAKRPVKRLEFDNGERPLGIQLYGSALDHLAEAVRIATDAKPDFVDINCGCWVKKIAGRGDGAGLLRDLGRFEQVVHTAIAATHLPITVKTRLGWDAGSIVIEEVARMVEQCGAQALTVHCRTRDQGYSGHADWTQLERIKAATTLPVIGNGDVTTPEHARRMLDTGCDGVMIGRGAIANPWIFAQTKHYLATGEHLPPPTPAERIDECLRHLRMSCEDKGEDRGIREFRKYYAGYLHGLPGLEDLRAQLVRITALEALEERLQRVL